MKKGKSKSSVIHVPLKDNELLEKALEAINTNKEILTLWKVMNVNAIDRLGMTDHGPVHFQIVANISLRMCRLLKEAGVEMSVVKYFGLDYKYAELVVLLASLFHDVGMSINRKGHEEFSLFLANNILKEILKYLPPEERTIVISETLHAIISHRSGGEPITLEAGIVRTGDALDMTKGRSRISYEANKLDIHSVSHSAIESVEIKKGENKIIQIEITMNNSAGLFQVDDLLKSKIKGSGLEEYIEVAAYIPEDTEKSLLKEIKFSG